MQARLRDVNTIRQQALNVFNIVDEDRSGYVEEAELFKCMKSVATALNLPLPTKADVASALRLLDNDRDGRVSYEEFVKLIIISLKRSVGLPIDEELKSPAPKAKLASSKLTQVDHKLEETGLKAAFKLIFAEVYTKQIDSTQAFKYLANRLQQIGQQAGSYR